MGLVEDINPLCNVEYKARAKLIRLNTSSIILAGAIKPSK